jgi:hypothetical protein
LRALENFSQGIGLIPEQIWDGPDLAARHLRFGGATNAAVPLLWAYSEYVKLHRSAADDRVFDFVEPAYERYVWRTGEHKNMESGANRAGRHAAADTGELSTPATLDRRRMAVLDRYPVATYSP